MMQSRNVARFVLMRFNVPFPGFEQLDNNDPDWLEYRVNLAELTAFHSLKLQSLGDFKLVILIDRAASAALIDGLRRATQGLETLLFKADSAAPIDISSFLLANVGTDCLAIQTSRIDSDDMFHTDYLRKINDYCAENDLFPELEAKARYFSFPQGQDYLTQSAKYNRILYPKNAFGTLVEPLSDGIQTVFCENHKRMSRRFASFSIDSDGPMWCRILHGGNLLNKARKPLPLADHFPVHPDLVKFAKGAPVYPRLRA